MSFDANPPYAPFKGMEAGTVIWDFDKIRLNNGFRVGTNLNLNLNLYLYFISASSRFRIRDGGQTALLENI